ncbi:MurR/RpiR family transcriptional regulator [Vagococcus fluvialis]|uniref:MurR/RpiR family transcriptional regulator n=1 Tax=Vagococcus fluvialis TaxID=2738 RepID=UPI003D1364DF
MDNRGISARNILLRFINNQKKQDNNYFIAQIMLENYDSIPQMTIYDLGEKCFVSTSAISRFVKLINFDSFTDFKSVVEKEIDISDDYSKKMLFSSNTKDADFITEYTDSIISNLNFVKKNIQIDQIERVIKCLYDCTDIAVFGLEFASFLGQHFQNKMASMNKIVQVGFTKSEQLKIVDEMKNDGIALIFSMEGSYFYFSEKVVTELKKKNIKIIVFTFKNSPIIGRSADEIVFCGEMNENTEGRLSVLYMMELLIFYYMKCFYLD